MTTTTDVRERPIIFSGAMVRAILDGKKTQTRRVIKPQPEDVDENGRWYRMPNGGQSLNCFTCPHGAPGDRLWVRERWAVRERADGLWAEYAAGGDSIAIPTEPHLFDVRDDNGRVDPARYALPDGSWRPSIHMPRWASRLTLEITSIRVERVQEISRADELAEGVQPFREDAPDELPDGIKFRAFSALWDHLNEARGYGWVVNPWVWVIEFKRGGR